MRLFYFGMALGLFCFLCDGAFAEKRVALVIGNSAYQHAPVLPNPKNDAEDMAAALGRLGFDVTILRDLNTAQFDSALDAFIAKAGGADIAFFFFAGHGLQIDKRGFLVPVDTKAESESGALRELVAIPEAVARIESAAKVSIIVLDACRDSPLHERLRRVMLRTRGLELPQGLPKFEVTGSNTLVVYATAAGEAAGDGRERNSPFTGALLKHIETPGQEIERMFKVVTRDVVAATGGKQQPERYSRLQEEVVLKAEQKLSAQIRRIPNYIALTAERESALKPGDDFRECDDCPQMVVIPKGEFMMGTPQAEIDALTKRYGVDWFKFEAPQHKVTIPKQFAVGRFAVTFDEWDACVADGGCNGYKPLDNGWGRGDRPVIAVSWDDAQAYVTWLKKKTGKDYRLLSAAEREYATRAGTSTEFWWGNSISTDRANYKGNSTQGVGLNGEFRQKTLPVKSFQPNPWGLYQVHGNVYEWVEDCWNDSYANKPLAFLLDGGAWPIGNCGTEPHALRGGSWNADPFMLRPAYRSKLQDGRFADIGFRVARTLNLKWQIIEKI